MGTGTGTSRWLAGLTSPYLADNAVTIRRLAYALAIDLWNNTAIAAGTTDIFANQAFSVDGPASLVEFSIRGMINYSTPTVGGICAVELVIDNGAGVRVAGAPSQVSGVLFNPVQGTGIYATTGFVARAHTVRAHLNTTHAGNAYLRAATFAPEFFALDVKESRK